MRRLAIRAAWLGGGLLALLALNFCHGRLIDYWQDIVIQCGIAAPLYMLMTLAG